MGSAMVRAWLDSGLAQTIDICDPHGFPEEFVSAAAIRYCAGDSGFLDRAPTWDALIVAIKPQGLDEFCESVKLRLPPALPVLSIAAGRTIGSFQKYFGASHPVIRSMPNTPAAIGKGISVAVAAESVTGGQKRIAENLLAALGHVEWAEDESLMDAVTALSGSGPAYLFYMIEAMAKAGEQAGLEKDFAMRLARRTVIGAAALAEDMAEDPAALLRENVTSPNGTTEAALGVLMDGRLQAVMNETLAAAVRRSKELSS